MSRRVVRQAGAIVYRGEQPREVLLVRAKRTPAHWIFPKGHLEPGESPAAAALREAREEAGVEGRLVSPVGPPLTFRWGDDDVHVEYFLVECLRQADDYEPREQVWLPPEQALRRITHDDARRLLRTALALLAE